MINNIEMIAGNDNDDQIGSAVSSGDHLSNVGTDVRPSCTTQA